MILNSQRSIPVVVAGALGRMGAEVIKAVHSSKDCVIVGAIETSSDIEGIDVGTKLGLGTIDVPITTDFEGCLCSASQAVRDQPLDEGVVLVDFTHPSVVYEHTRAAIAYGVHPVIGTTGLTPAQIQELSEFASKASISMLILFNMLV